MSRRLTGVANRPWIGRVTVLLAAAAVAAIDLVAKAVSEARLADTTVDLGMIQLQLVFNPGVAFSMGDKLPSGVIVAITAAISVAIAVYAWYRAPRAGWLERVAAGAVIGGAVANVVDRARDGVVTDYLHTGWWPTFNLADTFLVTGCLVIALLQARPEQDAENAQPPEDQPTQRADTDSTEETWT